AGPLGAHHVRPDGERRLRPLRPAWTVSVSNRRMARTPAAGVCGRTRRRSTPAPGERNAMTRWLRFERKGRVGVGTLEGDTITVRSGDMFPRSMPAGESVQLADLKILTPSEPSKMICLWNNFHQLAAKNDFPVPEEPLYFLKAPNAYRPHGAPIVRPKTY